MSAPQRIFPGENTGALEGRVLVAEAERDALAAENAALREALLSCESPYWCPSCDEKLGPQRHRDDCLLWNCDTPATDAAIQRVRDDALEEAARVAGDIAAAIRALKGKP